MTQWLDEMRRALGGHDLRFHPESWSVFLDQSHDDDATKCDKKVVFKGSFLNWPLWKGEATARMASHHLDSFEHDENGGPICGYVAWRRGFSISDGEIEGFDNGTIELASVIAPEIFDNVLTLLRGSGTHLEISFTLSNGLSEAWDGSKPLHVNAVRFYITGH